MNFLHSSRLLPILMVLSFLSVSCGKKESDHSIDELAQQMGDVMASMDESDASGSGSLGMKASGGPVDRAFAAADLDADRLIRDSGKLFARYGQELHRSALIPEAQASSCTLASTYGSCSSNTRVRTFSNCTLGFATISGTVTLTWGVAATSCAITGTGGTITRVPDFTVTGLRGGSLTVSKTGTVGQQLTYNSGSGASAVYSYSNDGIRRKFAINGSTILDFTTVTTSAISITGQTRAGRSLGGGGLKVTNNLTSVDCTYYPAGITWTSACNCPVSGAWVGSCSNGKNSSLTITGCGTGFITHGDATVNVSFDRCY